MKQTFALVALLACASAIKIKYNDLPSTADVDKLDPLSRYVNDDDLIQLSAENQAKLEMYMKYDDLPSNAEVEKLDPLSRYVNDDDLVQVHDS